MLYNKLDKTKISFNTKLVIAGTLCYALFYKTNLVMEFFYYNVISTSSSYSEHMMMGTPPSNNLYYTMTQTATNSTFTNAGTQVPAEGRTMTIYY